MCRRTERRRNRQQHSAIHSLVRRQRARRTQSLPKVRREIETRCSCAIQSRETRRCPKDVEIQGSFRHSIPQNLAGCRQSKQARLVFPRSHKRPVAIPVAAEAINPKHDQCRHWSEERLRLELLRGKSRRGCNPGVLSICRARSGEALIRNQRKTSESPLMAILDCVCGAILPVRAAAAIRARAIPLRQAATRRAPRIRMRINRSFRSQIITFDQIAPA